MPEDEKVAPQISCKGNGPLVVVGVDDLTGPGGAAIEVKPRMALCRCGGSSKKPFCDGTHMKNGFDSAKQEGRTADRRKSYQGKQVTIHDNRGICSHAGVCTDSLPEVWRMQGGPWIDPDGSDAEAIADVVRRCPSGALAVELAAAAGGEAGAAPAIRVAKDGPYYVTGIELVDQEWGEGAEHGRYALCRCGASKNKPFCDGSHWDIKFRDG